MVRKMKTTKETIEKFLKSLEASPELLKEYSEYIENHNHITSNLKRLETDKV